MLHELLAAVMELAVGGDSALDLYSGVGFFTLPLAGRFREVVAVESDPCAHNFAAGTPAIPGSEYPHVWRMLEIGCRLTDRLRHPASI